MDGETHGGETAQVELAEGQDVFSQDDVDIFCVVNSTLCADRLTPASFV